MNLPKDPVMLLSVVNTQLRDHYPTLTELAAAYMTDADAITETLAASIIITMRGRISLFNRQSPDSLHKRRGTFVWPVVIFVHTMNMMKRTKRTTAPSIWMKTTWLVLSRVITRNVPFTVPGTNTKLYGTRCNLVPFS